MNVRLITARIATAPTATAVAEESASLPVGGASAGLQETREIRKLKVFRLATKQKTKKELRLPWLPRELKRIFAEREAQTLKNKRKKASDAAFTVPGRIISVFLSRSAAPHQHTNNDLSEPTQCHYTSQHYNKTRRRDNETHTRWLLSFRLRSTFILVLYLNASF